MRVGLALAAVLLHGCAQEPGDERAGAAQALCASVGVAYAERGGEGEVRLVSARPVHPAGRLVALCEVDVPWVVPYSRPCCAPVEPPPYRLQISVPESDPAAAALVGVGPAGPR